MVSLSLLLLSIFGFAGERKRLVHQENPVTLIASETGAARFGPPSSRWYTAVLVNGGKEPIRLNAIQMPGGYSGDGRFFPCYLQLWDKKNARWMTHRLYDFYPPQSTPHIVQVEVSPGTKLEVCNGLYPSQLGHGGDCVRFALSAERGQEPLFFSNTFEVIGGKKRSHGVDGCMGASR